MEALLRYFIAAPAVPLSQRIVRYVPTDTRSVLKIVRTAAGARELVAGEAALVRGRGRMGERSGQGSPGMHAAARHMNPCCPHLSSCAASVLWLPYQAYTLLLRPARPAAAAGGGEGGSGGGAPSGSPLGDTALLLLLVLVFHAPPQVTAWLLPGFCAGHRGARACIAHLYTVFGTALRMCHSIGPEQASHRIEPFPSTPRPLAAGRAIRQPVPPIAAAGAGQG